MILSFPRFQQSSRPLATPGFGRASSPAPIFRPAFCAQSDKAALRSKDTVSILGTSWAENEYIQAYLPILLETARRLSGLGYNILTGACRGVNLQGNVGAPPEQSFAITIEGNREAKNIRPDGQALYRVVEHLPAEDGEYHRIKQFNKLSRTMIFAPGGPASFFEFATTLFRMYEQEPGVPDRMILLGKDYFEGLDIFFKKMISVGFAYSERLKDLYSVVDVDPKNPGKAVEEVVRLVTQPQG